jgi:hypothetical protein
MVDVIASYFVLVILVAIATFPYGIFLVHPSLTYAFLNLSWSLYCHLFPGHDYSIMVELEGC